MNISDKKIKILVVDDHKVLRHGVTSILKEMDGFEIVGEAANGKEALLVLEDYAVDVVLLDIKMPVMNGNETLMNIRSKYPRVKVIMFSAHHEPGHEAHFLSAGASAFLDKNADFDLISETIIRISKEGFETKANNTIGPEISDEYLQLALSDIERKVLVMICRNNSGSEILKALNLKEGTLKYYRKSIYAKTRTGSLPELTIYAVKQGLIPFK